MFQKPALVLFLPKELYAFTMRLSPPVYMRIIPKIYEIQVYSPRETLLMCSRRLHKYSHWQKLLASCLNIKETFSDNFNKVLSVIIDPRLTSRRCLESSQLRSKVLFKRYKKALCASLHKGCEETRKAKRGNERFSFEKT